MPLPAPDMNSCCKKMCCKNRGGIYDTCDPCQGNGVFNPETCDCEQPENPYLYVSGISINCNCTWSSAGWIQYTPATDAQWFRPVSVTVNQPPKQYDCDEGYWFVPGLLYTAIWDDLSTRTFGGLGQSYSTDHIQSRYLIEWDWTPVVIDGMEPFANSVNCEN